MDKFWNHEERRVILTSGLILVVLTLMTTLIVLHIMQRQTQSLLTQGLQTALGNKVQLLEDQIERGIHEASEIATRPQLIKNLKQINSGVNSANALNDLRKIANGLVEANFAGIEIYDQKQNKITNAYADDKPKIESEFSVQLETDPSIHFYLEWDEQMVLWGVVNVVDENNQYIGSLRTKQFLSRTTKIYNDQQLVGASGEFVLCKSVENNSIEMDCFLSDEGGVNFGRVPRVIADQPVPMDHALNGQKGIVYTNDYKQIPVVAVHEPLAFGLGAVLKMDQEEFYYSIWKQAKTVSLFLLFSILSGMFMLYWLIRPLVNGIVDTKKKLLNSNAELSHSKLMAEKVTRELTAYMDAIGKLALISISDRSGRILQANEKFCELSGYSQEELIGKDHRVLNSGFHSRAFFMDMWATLAKGHIWHKEICNRNKNGQLYWVDSTIVPLRNEQGHIDRYLSVRVDITERKRKTMEMDKKLKEGNCLYLIRQDLAIKSDLEIILTHMIRHVIAAMYKPEFIAARVELFGTVVTSENYTGILNDGISVQIVINEKACGQLQLFSLTKEFFDLSREQGFIETIAYELGKWYERKEVEDRILRMATHDALTQLPNRHLLQDRLEQTLASDERYHLKMAVLFIDLDYFKSINDTEGHEIGDLLLKDVAKRLLQCVRKEDTVSRQGGDEFIVVLHQIQAALDADLVAQKILDALKKPFYIQNKVLYIGSSIGIAVFPDDGRSASVLLKHSDLAMYHAKESGRNNYKFFTRELNAFAREQQILKTELCEALRKDQLVLFFQPVFSMPGYELKGLEVLLRWDHPERKLIMPQQFISLAEESGMIVPIGEWVINAACKQLKTWQEFGFNIPQIAINLSAKQFRDNSLINKISEILANTGISGQQIALEITESLLIDDFENVEKTITQLKAMGIQLSIDDFGTGYSNFGYLKRFQIDTLKIDRSFVRDITINSGDYAIIASMVALAKNLGLDIIAEGVETREQLELLMQSGCNQFQGYFFGKPLPVQEIEQFFESNIHQSRKKVIHAN